MNKVWEESERTYIKNNASKMKDRELAEELTKITGRKITVQAVRKQRQKMGISKERGRGICAVVDKAKHTSNSGDICRGIVRQTQNYTSPVDSGDV